MAIAYVLRNVNEIWFFKPALRLCLKINTRNIFHIVSHIFGLQLPLKLFEDGTSFWGCNSNRKLLYMLPFITTSF
jgi:hypothetical protein